MTPDQYSVYLLSPEWKQVAERRKAIDKYRCCMCGSRGTMNNPLEVHHVTYRSVGNENVYADLMTLCRSCHRSIHTAMSRITDENGRRGWKDSLPISNHVIDDKY